MVPRRLLDRQALWSLGLICLLALLVMGLPPLRPIQKIPDPGPKMRFVIVRSNAPGCEPICPEWISAEGSIGQRRRCSNAAQNAWASQTADRRRFARRRCRGGADAWPADPQEQARYRRRQDLVRRLSARCEGLHEQRRQGRPLFWRALCHRRDCATPPAR